ncbi:hypothetical protein BCR32DRAFT_275556 [Anaeromyces robustus]|uniref:Uncharacterized protein n=1 Tax=Anaeromyces robustus TaxID=1754192 RepID=A0A1Y1XK87_9FUNG|nr:hypothetical protein BCR32DRAFT_275556 [Anaeromyces robustus]|eukprot:ORX86168.1 hypothetical protein BCR32DRAFT_275556 [Anaeromyces robustus]
MKYNKLLLVIISNIVLSLFIQNTFGIPIDTENLTIIKRRNIFDEFFKFIDEHNPSNNVNYGPNDHSYCRRCDRFWN